MRPRLIGQYAVYVAVRLTICIVQAIRLETCAVAAQGLAWIISDVVRLRGKLIDENLAHAYPEWTPAKRREVARRMWEHLFLFVCEIAHTGRKVHDTNWRDHVEIVGATPSVKYLFAERAVMIITAHHGNFELAGYILGVLGFPTYSVARKLDNPFLDNFVNSFRSLTGQFIVPKKGGYDQIIDVLSRRGTMCFLADQYAGTKGCWVNFFDRPASAHKAIALFALDNDAVVMVGCARRLKKPLQYRMTIHSILDPRTAPPELQGMRPLTAWYTSELEKMIREAPEQYWWLHRRWKDHRPAKKKRQAA